MSPLPWEGYALFLAPAAALGCGFFLFHRLAPRWTCLPILSSCAVVAWASVSLARQVLHGAAWDQTLWHWLGAGRFGVDFGVRLDGLGCAVLAMVAVVGTMIHVYAVGYMRGDPGFSRFFLYFHLFFLSMIGLLISNNYLQFYLFWEGVGLASYLLIGFWFEKEAAREAALKAFLVNRVGDASFLLGVFLLLAAFGTTRFVEIFERLTAADGRLLSLIALLLFGAAAAKSAQFPLYVWLPDAMEGPTPTSALMHAATMVTAGVFLMARSWPLLARAPEVLRLVAWTGAGTALAAAVLASIKKDLKRILAYSTISHLGLMMLAVGAGNVFAAVFHLITHGFFKALLFLCAGNVLHGLGKPSADIEDAGGLGAALPATLACFLVGTLAAGGFFPFSGFFSKDLILAAVFATGSRGLETLAALVSAGSSFYMFRMLWLTFCGGRPRQRGRESRVHEAGAWMLAPVVALAAGAAACGFWEEKFHRLFSAAPLWTGAPFELAPVPSKILVLGTGAAFAGLAASYVLFMLLPEFEWSWREKAPLLAEWLDADLGWQAVARQWVAAPVAALAAFTAWDWDYGVWDRFVEAAADALVGLGEGLSGLTRGLANEYIWFMAAGLAALLFGIVV